MRKLILAGVVASLLIAAPVATAKIIVGKSIAGVRLGISENDVVATLGQPAKTTDRTDQITGQPQRELDYGKTKVVLTGGVVTLVATASKKEKTSKGARVGISEKSLRKKVNGLKCDGKGSKRICYRGKFLPGKTITTFFFSAKKVDEIQVGLVLD